MPSGRLGRGTCGCGTQVITVRYDTRTGTVGTARSDTGSIAVDLGTWRARYVPVGDRVLPPYYRYREHVCGEPVPSITEPHRAAQSGRLAAATRRHK